MHLLVEGLNYRGAPLSVRERVFLPGEALRGWLERLGAKPALTGGAILSTCNRTELYVAGADAERRAEAALLELSGLREDELAPALYRLRDEAAALHLFRVAAGLDSLVPGEGEILGQVRSAYEAGATGSVLDRVFRQAHVRREEGACADRDRREPGVGLLGGRRARPAGLSGSCAARGSS